MAASHSGLLSQCVWVLLGLRLALMPKVARPTSEPKEHPALDFFMSSPQDSQ